MDTGFRFGDFELHADCFELSRVGHALRLERMPLELLIPLTLNRGRVMTRSETAEHLWGRDVFVDTSTVSTLRSENCGKFYVTTPKPLVSCRPSPARATAFSAPSKNFLLTIRAQSISRH